MIDWTECPLVDRVLPGQYLAVTLERPPLRRRTFPSS